MMTIKEAEKKMEKDYEKLFQLFCENKLEYATLLNALTSAYYSGMQESTKEILQLTRDIQDTEEASRRE